MLSRRAFVALGLFGGAYWLSRNGDLWDRFGPLPEFSTDGVPEGFRKLVTSGAGISAGLSNPLIGITAPADPTPPARLKLTPANQCELLFGEPVPVGVVPLAYFTDYNCPYCRVLGKELASLEQELGQTIRIRWHEMPLLGDTSVLAARAAIAAGLQGAYLPFHKRLNTGVVRINRTYIAAITNDLSLDFAQLERDMVTPATDVQLAQSAAVADAFGVIGTPFLLVGRTAVYGRISTPLLRRLIELERAESAADRCS